MMDKWEREVQTRDDSGSLRFFPSLKLALTFSLIKDPCVWKISFSFGGKHYRMRSIRSLELKNEWNPSSVQKINHLVTEGKLPTPTVLDPIWLDQMVTSELFPFRNNLFRRSVEAKILDKSSLDAILEERLEYISTLARIFRENKNFIASNYLIKIERFIDKWNSLTDKRNLLEDLVIDSEALDVVECLNCIRGVYSSLDLFSRPDLFGL